MGISMNTYNMCVSLKKESYLIESIVDVGIFKRLVIWRGLREGKEEKKKNIVISVMLVPIVF